MQFQYSTKIKKLEYQLKSEEQGPKLCAIPKKDGRQKNVDKFEETTNTSSHKIEEFSKIEEVLHDFEDEGGGIEEEEMNWWDDRENPDNLDLSFALPQISDEFLISEEQVNQNFEAQVDEIDSLKSIFDEDFGEIGTQHSCIIKISCGRYEVRLMVDMPKTYPSLDPPAPTILGAWWPEFNLEEMNERLLSSFERETICIYDWTVMISDHLQELMENVVKQHKTKVEKNDFHGQLNGLVLDLEKGLAFQDLEDEENYIDRFSRSEQDYIFKCVKNCLMKKKNRTKKILKRIHKKIPNMIAKHLYWALKIYSQYDSVPIQKYGHAIKFRNIPREYRLEEVSKKTHTCIQLDKNSNLIYIFGPKESKDEAKAMIISNNAVKVLMGLLNDPRVKNFVIYQSDTKRHPKLKLLYQQQRFLSHCGSRAFYQTHYTTQQMLTIISALQYYIENNQAIKVIPNFGNFLGKDAPNVIWSNKSGRQEARIRLGDGFAGGMILYHGTKACNVNAIIEQGLRINGGAKRAPNGSAYGRGIYTADSINIPLGYAGAQPAYFMGTKWLCVFQVSARKSSRIKQVSGGIYVIKREDSCRVTHLILIRTA